MRITQGLSFSFRERIANLYNILIGNVEKLVPEVFDKEKCAS